MFGDIDIISPTSSYKRVKNLRQELSHQSSCSVKTRNEPYMSTFEDLLSMKTRAFLVKDIDPKSKTTLGNRSLATELSEEQIDDYYSSKIPKPTNATELSV